MRRLGLCLLLVFAACGGDSPDARFDASAASTTSTTASTTTTTVTTVTTVPRPVTTAVRRPRVTAPPTTRVVPRPNETIEVPYRIEVRTSDPVGADFANIVNATLHDERGWQRARFRLVHRDDAEYVVMLAEPADAQELCKPYDVYSQYSCQNGPRVVLNAERWRKATPQWTGDLATYRQMLVNHEFGHLLGQHHPKVQCPERGRAAAIMAQQSTELNGCLPNPWPLQWEIDLAARHDEPLAPPYSR